MYYFRVDRDVPPTGHFSVDVFENENVLYIDVFDGINFVAAVGAILFFSYSSRHIHSLDIHFSSSMVSNDMFMTT